MNRTVSLKEMFFLFLCLFATVGMLPAQHPMEPIRHEYDLEHVKRLEADGRFDIVLYQGTREKVEIEAANEVVAQVNVAQGFQKVVISSMDIDVYEPVTIRITLDNVGKDNRRGVN